MARQGRNRLGRGAATAIACALALSVFGPIPPAGAGDPAGTVTIFPELEVGIPISVPVSGAGGDVWFVARDADEDHDDHSLVRRAANGTLSSFAPPELGAPEGLTAEPDGTIWFVNRGGPPIGRISTNGDIAFFDDPEPDPDLQLSFSGDLVVGSDGTVWAFGRRGYEDAGFVRISPEGDFTFFSSPLGDRSSPSVLVPGTSGEIWFTAYEKTPWDTWSLFALHPDGTTERIVDPDLESVESLAVGLDGTVWFSNTHALLDDTSIGRIAPGGEITYQPLGTARASHFVSDASGVVWFKLTGGLKAGGRIDPDGMITLLDLEITPAITGPDGYVWGLAGSSPTSTTIGRIAPSGAAGFFDLPGVVSVSQVRAGSDGNIYWWVNTGAWPSPPRVGSIGTVLQPMSAPGGSLVNGTVGAEYSATVHANGGLSPYTWTLTAGSLPPGLTLAPSGRIAGTPTVAGAFTFTLEAVDSLPEPNIRAAVHTITVVPSPVASVEWCAAREATSCQFTIKLSHISAWPASVSYATVTGTASAGDFTGQSGAVTFEPGQVAKTVSVPFTDDDLTEPNESIALILSSPVGATLGANGVGIIQDGTVVITAKFSAGEAGVVAQSSSYYGEGADPLRFGARLIRFFDILSGPGGLEPWSPVPQSSGDAVTLTARYTQAEAAAMQDLANRVGAPIEAIHIGGVRVVNLFWWIDTAA